MPLLEQAGFRVVDWSASLFAEDGHEEAYLVRAFASLEAHREQQDGFYSSDAWRCGPREAIVSRIEDYHTIVLETSEEAVTALQRMRQHDLDNCQSRHGTNVVRPLV